MNKPMFDFSEDFQFNKKQSNAWYKAAANTLYIVVLLLMLSYIVFAVVFFDAEVDGTSMQPTLNAKGGNKSDVVYVNRFAGIKKGDIVVFKVNGRGLIKRVIAVGGDRIRYEYNDETGVCELYINGELQQENYIKEELKRHDELTRTGNELEKIMLGGENYIEGTVVKNDNGTPDESDDFYEYVVPKNAYFCMGDNRLVSEDCRRFGAVDKSAIQGKVRMVVPYGTSKFSFWLNKLFGIW